MRIKKIKKIFLALVVFTLPFFIAFSKSTISSIEVHRSEAVTVQITASSDDEKLIYENELVKIEIGCDQYVAFLEDRIALYESDEYLVVRFEEPKAAILAANSCAGAGISLKEYDAVNILEAGMGAVYDKQTGTWVNSIQIWYYSYSCGPLCGEGSRSFYLPDKTMFIHVVDMNS